MPAPVVPERFKGEAVERVVSIGLSTGAVATDAGLREAVLQRSGCEEARHWEKAAPLRIRVVKFRFVDEHREVWPARVTSELLGLAAKSEGNSGAGRCWRSCRLA